MDSKPIKRKMTDKQKAARNTNLEKARAKRAEMASANRLVPKKSKKKDTDDISSDNSSIESFSDDSSSSGEAFTISKTKKSKPTQTKSKRKQPKDELVNRNEFNQVINMIENLTNMQKKQLKKQSKRSSGGGNTTINLPPNIVPASTPVVSHASRPMDPYLEAMRKSIFD